MELGIDPATGAVARFIAGKAKWRATLTPAAMGEMTLGEWAGPPGARVRSGESVWADINSASALPDLFDSMDVLAPSAISPHKITDISNPLHGAGGHLPYRRVSRAGISLAK